MLGFKTTSCFRRVDSPGTKFLEKGAYTERKKGRRERKKKEEKQGVPDAGIVRRRERERKRKEAEKGRVVMRKAQLNSARFLRL